MLRTTNSRLFWAVLASAFCPSRPMRMILLNMVLGSVSFGCVRCLRYMLARRVCRRQAPPKATGRNLWKGTQTCFGGGVHTSQRRESGFREGERASEGRGLHVARHAERQTERQ